MADDLRPIRRRDDLPPLERAVSDALDELNVRCYGRVSGWVYPVQFLEFLAQEGHTVVPAAELETTRAQLAAIDALHPHTELDWWHPCKRHSITDEESTLNACPNCVVETVMGCPRCDDACEYRKILHPDFLEGTTDVH